MSKINPGEKHWNHKLNERNVERILELNKLGMRSKDLAKMFKVSTWTINNILDNKSWKNISRD